MMSFTPRDVVETLGSGALIGAIPWLIVWWGRGGTWQFDDGLQMFGVDGGVEWLVTGGVLGATLAVCIRALRERRDAPILMVDQAAIRYVDANVETVIERARLDRIDNTGTDIVVRTDLSSVRISRPTRRVRRQVHAGLGAFSYPVGDTSASGFDSGGDLSGNA